MKFYTSILFLIIFTTVFSYNVEINKREDNIDWDTFEKCEDGKLSLFSKDCKSQYDSVSKLLEKCDNAIKEKCNFEKILNSSFNEDSINEICFQFYDNINCNDIIEEGVFVLPECKKLSENLIQRKNKLIEYNDSYIRFRCAEDENGEVCPLTKYFMDTSYILEDNEVDPETLLEDSINENCKSSICTTTAYESYTKIMQLVDEVNEDLEKRQYKYDSNLSENKNLEKMLEYLKSDNCTSQAIIYYNAGFSIQYNNLLFCSLSFMLLFIFKII
ncbi:hypothetical protein H8356DRAFT_1740043 [Neocallimastix lanati (nom. inval.)]|jgi:hypothetical protein|uniref:Uncharacterized protein n=1 Tax=Neocallimastix californiae TaxID=1754190 RepID=A0A1Y2D0J8_9FUNG|nr:hypothetical protein H8356DRAFT_1740043 [Neocallimastix sp. JGI-2020a]ORY52809.1 hypothetical protein LY90DRAFT_702680 [Neocallimastix californiae]|eukprot:ORY52809.1 hypothetical protein LY90DRAFT_702680 [Neocallimastix californiae]